MSKSLKILTKSSGAKNAEKNMAYYAPFIRVSDSGDEQIVEGIASSEAIDSYGDIVRASAIKDALPEYMKYANLRSMHSNIAAGTVIDAKVDETQKVFYITAKVVDDNEWKKVKEKVYKGFSIGGIIEDWEPIMVEVKDKDGNAHEVFTGGYEILKIKLVEISLVDRPANPDALIQSYKAAKLRKFDTEDGEVDAEENFVPSVVLQPDLTRIGNMLDNTNRPSSMKTLVKRNPLSILAPRTMSKVTKAQMQTVADDAIKAAMKEAGITDDTLNELKTLSRGEIIEAAKELVAEVVDHLAVFVKAEGVEPSEGAVETDPATPEKEEPETVEEASEDDTTGQEEEKEAAAEAEESTEEEVEEKEEEVEEEKEEEETVPAEKSEETNAIVDALKALGETIKKSNEDTVAEIKKANKSVVTRFESFAKKAGVSAQPDDEEVDEDDTEEENEKTAFAKNDPWGKKIA